MTQSIIAENTRRIIQERGLKYKAVAQKVGMSEGQFSAILTGRKVVKDVDVISIANALGVTPNDLFGLDAKSTGSDR